MPARDRARRQPGVDPARLHAEIGDEVAAEARVHLDHLRASGGQLVLGVRHAVGEAERGMRVPHHLQQEPIGEQRVPGVHDVPYLLEVRWVADLLAGHEHGKHPAAVHRRVHADLRPGEILLHQDSDVITPRPGQGGVARERELSGQLIRAGDQHRAQARRHGARLEHHGVADLVGRGQRFLQRGDQDRACLGHFRGRQRLAGQVLVAAAHRRVRIAAGQAQRGRYLRSLQHAGLIPGQHAGQWPGSGDIGGSGDHVGRVDRLLLAAEHRPAGHVAQFPSWLGPQQQVYPVAGADRGQQVLPVVA